MYSFNVHSRPGNENEVLIDTEVSCNEYTTVLLSLIINSLPSEDSVQVSQVKLEVK